jgi:hypothetical protein
MKLKNNLRKSAKSADDLRTKFLQNRVSMLFPKH